MRRFLFILLICGALFGKVLTGIEALSSAVRFRWEEPEEDFCFGLPLSFEVTATNVAEDSAVVHKLYRAAIYGDSFEGFDLISPGTYHLRDTLAPGEEILYYYIYENGAGNFYDPYEFEKTYEKEVGLPALAPGEYSLHYRPSYNGLDTLIFTIAPPREEDSSELDSMAQLYIAYQREKPERAISLARYLSDNTPNSPFTARALVLGRGIA